MFIITKIWPTYYDKVEETIKAQLKLLQLDYIDLYLLHWPLRAFNTETNEFQKIPTHKLWADMESLVKKGFTKSIGVSNFNAQILIDIFTYCEIKPVVNEFECHPYYIRKNLIDFSQKFDIHVIAYSSLVSAHYTKSKLGCSLLEEPIIVELSKKYNKSNAQIALNWALCKNLSVIPKSSDIKRILENFEASNFKLSNEDVAKIDSLDKNLRFCDEIDTWEEFGLIDIFA